MAGQREQIGQQLHTLYLAGVQSRIKLLLSQNDSANLARNLAYHDYLLAARRTKMRDFLDSMDQLRKVEQEIAEAIAGLEQMQAQLEQEHSKLLSIRNERQQLLASADTALQQKGESLEQLERDRTALQSIVDQIEQQRALAQAQEEKRKQDEARQREQQLAQQKQEQQTPAQQTPAQQTPEQQTPEQQPPATASSKRDTVATYSAEDLTRLQSIPFAQRKGSMTWPVSGNVISQFGEKRQGSVTWDGIRIQAPAGSEVRAVHGGRVMYADWLRGQGMLLVLDHGNGYMSLYAHNDVLLQEPGQWVKPGDVIARTGNSGGEKEPALYFEIRQNGRPVNPRQWLGKP